MKTYGGGNAVAIHRWGQFGVVWRFVGLIMDTSGLELECPCVLVGVLVRHGGVSAGGDGWLLLCVVLSVKVA